MRRVGGSRMWLAVTLITGISRFFHRHMGRHPETVYLEKLRPGERLVISHLAPEAPGGRTKSRSRRRRARSL